jgi:hypothetical protein
MKDAGADCALHPVSADTECSELMIGDCVELGRGEAGDPSDIGETRRIAVERGDRRSE